MQSILPEPSTEEDLPMLRSRLASLAVACGLLITLSGCCSMCEDGRLRLFSGSQRTGSSPGIFSHQQPQCECNQGHMPGIFDTTSSHGPVLMTPASSNPTMPIPITNMPTMQPPQVFKLPLAAPTPYSPAH
jgi:hypothetical protein